MAEKKDIKEKVLWVIDSKTNERSGGGTDLRVVQWIVDGKPTKPGLEKREWFEDRDSGERKVGKAKAMTSFDLAKVITNIKKIAKLLQMPADHLDEALQLAMYQDEKPGAPAGKPPASMGSEDSIPGPSSTTILPGAVPEEQF